MYMNNFFQLFMYMNNRFQFWKWETDVSSKGIEIDKMEKEVISNAKRLDGEVAARGASTL